MQQLTNYLDAELEEFFETEDIDQLAKDSAFIQREHYHGGQRITGAIFLDLLIFHNTNLKKQSLDDLSLILKKHYAITISKQGLDKRFNQYAVQFLSNALSKLLTTQLSRGTKGILQGKFNRVLVKDSVCFQLHPSLKEYYGGSGGDGSEAAMRIQFEYELLSGAITDLSINAFNDQDATDSLATIELTQVGDLILRDLAYMNTKVIKKLMKRFAYYLCRVKIGVKIYERIDQKYIELDFSEIIKFMKEHNITVLEKEVYYGAKDKLKTRLIICLLPPEAYAKRLKKAKRDSIREGRGGNITKEQKIRAELSLFITNTSQDQIPKENVWPVYRLRWQIELMFKTWKSICEIDHVKKVKKERLECYILSKLFFIVLAWQMLWITARLMYDLTGQGLSFYKALKTLYAIELQDFHEALLASRECLVVYLTYFFEISSSKHVLGKQKLDEISSLEMIQYCLTRETNFYQQ
ncbi:IS4 family transposase [Patescibacteria group bacterium]|nr:IS4 family transposase [Patescibacteria group bacterium]